jgi:hypothetical protein
VGVQAYNAFIRALEQERKIEEQEEISGRVEVLESRVEAGGDGVVSIIRNRLKLEGEVPERCNE